MQEIRFALVGAGHRGRYMFEAGCKAAEKIIPVAALPTESAEENAIYLVPSESSDEENVYDEYVYVDGAWEKLSGAGVAVNLEEYLKKTDADKQYVVIQEKPEANWQGVYGIAVDGTQTVFTAGAGQAAHKVAITDAYGCLYVADPRLSNHAASKYYVDNLVGDIETALDGIVAIQDSLIDSIIAFTLYYENDSVTTELEAEEGMTWREWVDSTYNTIGAYVTDSDTVYHSYNGEDHYIYHTYDWENDIYENVKADDVIEAGHQYLCKYFG